MYSILKQGAVYCAKVYLTGGVKRCHFLTRSVAIDWCWSEIRGE